MKINRIVVLAFSLCILSTVGKAQDRWTPVGPVNLRASQKLADGRVCIATNAGYLLWSTDDGVSFTHQQIDTGSGLNSVSFLRTNVPTIGYVGADSNRIYRTTDGGSSWNRVSAPTTVGINFITAITTDTVFVCGGSGTFVRSTDGGASWKAIPIATKANLLKLFFLDGQHGYATTDSGAILETTNSGDSWNAIPAPFTTNPVSVFDISQNGALFAGSTYGMVAVSQDDGTTWTTNRVDKNFAGAFDFGKFVSEDTIVALQNGQIYFYVSINGGVTWDSIPSGTGNYNDSWKSDAGTFTLIGNQGSVWPVNISAGITSGALGTVIHNFANAGVYLDPVPSKSSHIHSALNGPVSFLGGTIHSFTSDGGYSWTGQQINTVASAIGLHFTSDDTGVFLYEESSNISLIEVQYTTDNGTTWTNRNSPNLHGPWNSYALGSDGTMFMTNDTDIAFSTNNGLDWALWGACRVEPDSNASPYSMGSGVFWGKDSASLHIYDPNGTLPTYTLAQTTNRGISWTTSAMGPEVGSSIFVNPNDGVMIVQETNHVWLTSDAGLQWTGPQEVGPSNKWFWGINFNSSGTIGVICGDTGDLYETFDTGRTWIADPVPFFFNQKGRLNSPTFTDDTTVFLQGQSGMYRRTFHLNNSSESVSSGAEQNNELITATSYPNPFRTFTNISYSLPSDGLVTILIYNSAGIQLARIASEYETAGAHIRVFDGSNLPDGSYRAEIEAASSNGTITRQSEGLSLIR